MASSLNASDGSVGQALAAAYNANANDCSGFVREVAARLGFTLTGNADALVDAFRKTWRELDKLDAVMREVRAGRLVVAGLKSTEHTPTRTHGHVVVIVDGPLYMGKYPLCWGGSIGNAQSQGTKSVGEVWSSHDRDNVSYFGPR